MRFEQATRMFAVRELFRMQELSHFRTVHS
jgi:hypothetical protein